MRSSVLPLVVVCGLGGCWLSIDESKIGADAGAIDAGAVDALPDAPTAPPATCAELVAAGEPKTTGIHTVTIDGAKTAVYCDMTDPPKTLVYRASAGVAGDAFTLLVGAPSDPEAEATPTRTGTHYVSRLLQRWNAGVTITEAWTRAYDAKGDVVLELQFDAKGSTPTDFFTKERLRRSPWTDVSGATQFSAAGAVTDKRRFFIHLPFSVCETDDGWLFVGATKDTAVCPYEKPADKIRIFYAPGSTATRWNVTFAEASSFTIFVR